MKFRKILLTLALCAMCVGQASALECVDTSSISFAPPQAAGLTHSAVSPFPTKSFNFAGALFDALKVYQDTDSKTLDKGAVHFTETSIWTGNVCVAGHNRGVNTHFGKIHTLETGDTITLTTKLGTRTYSVSSVEKVDGLY